MACECIFPVSGQYHIFFPTNISCCKRYSTCALSALRSHKRTFCCAHTLSASSACAGQSGVSVSHVIVEPFISRTLRLLPNVSVFCFAPKKSPRRPLVRHNGRLDLPDAHMKASPLLLRAVLFVILFLFYPCGHPAGSPIDSSSCS